MPTPCDSQRGGEPTDSTETSTGRVEIRWKRPSPFSTPIHERPAQGHSLTSASIDEHPCDRSSSPSWPTQFLASSDLVAPTWRRRLPQTSRADAHWRVPQAKSDDAQRSPPPERSAPSRWNLGPDAVNPSRRLSLAVQHPAGWDFRLHELTCVAIVDHTAPATMRTRERLNAP